MLTKDTESRIISLSFVILIVLLTIGVIIKFQILDFAYLLFIIGCFVRYIYIKIN
ncbi:MAG: hypothetical protein HFH45_05275 [Bacilli bacterium]|nr:hypothetical protein [Bacilli bacterium]